MSRPRPTRRELLLGGLSAASGLLLTGCRHDLPSTYGNILRMGDALTYAAHRALLPTRGLAREYSRADISSFPAIGTTDPGNAALPTFNPAYGETYAKLRHGGFADWGLEVAGRVARPGTYSLTALQQMPSRQTVPPQQSSSLVQADRRGTQQFPFRQSFPPEQTPQIPPQPSEPQLFPLHFEVQPGPPPPLGGVGPLVPVVELPLEPPVSGTLPHAGASAANNSERQQVSSTAD